MDIIAQLKAERDKAAQQVNALDTAIRALSGLNTTGSTRAAKDECRRTSENFCLTKSTLRREHEARELSQWLPSVTSQRQVWRGSERQIGRDGQSGGGKANHFRASAYLPSLGGHSDLFDRMWFLTRLLQPESARLSHPLTSGT